MENNKLHIFVLEDEINQQAAIVSVIMETYPQAEITCAQTLSEAQEHFYKSEFTYSLFFIDINLKGLNFFDQSGFLFAKEIRENDKYAFTPIVYITSVLEMELISFRETQCYQYLLKPFDRKKIEEILLKVVLNFEKKKNREPVKWIIKKNGIHFPLLVDDILYIESIFRGICIHLRKEDFEVPYTSLGRAKEALSPYQFLQCHKSYIINANYIEHIDFPNRFIRLKEKNKLIDIGKAYQAQLKEWMNERSN